MHKYCISGLVLKINAEEWIIHSNLKSFICTSDNIEPDVNCSIFFTKPPDIANNVKGIIKSAGFMIYKNEDYYYIKNNDEKDIPSLFVASNDWSNCDIYIDPTYNKLGDNQTVNHARDALLAILREVFIAALSRKYGVLVHSSSIIWNGEGVLFSAPSGEGKSTHTNMWRQKYGTEILDGDVTALRIIDEVPYAYGLPWCGTSGEFLNKRVPLRAVVFLQRAEKNRIEKLNFQEAFIRLASRCFMLPYDERMTNQFINVVQEIASKTDCYLLECLPDYEAVELVKKCLEKS